MTLRLVDAAVVGIVQCRPETVASDVERLLELVWPAATRRPRPPRWSTAVAPPLPTPAGRASPWLLTLLERSWPAGLNEASAAAADEAVGDEATVILAGVTTCRRLRVRGALAAAWQSLAVDLSPSREARRPEGLAQAWKRWPRERFAGGVLDLTVCGDGAGPAVADPLMLNLLLASRDLVALDAVAALVLGFGRAPGPLTSAAATAGWGVADLDRIELRGDSALARPLVASRGSSLPSSGWLAEDLPRWLAALHRRWEIAGWPGRRRRQRYAALPWARFASDPRVDVEKGNA